MTGRISIPALREKAEKGGTQGRVTPPDLLALVEAVEAARVVSDADPLVTRGEWRILADALARFDFGEDERAVGA